MKINLTIYFYPIDMKCHRKISLSNINLVELRKNILQNIAKMKYTFQTFVTVNILCVNNCYANVPDYY